MSSKTLPFQNLRLTTLGVIAELVKGMCVNVVKEATHNYKPAIGKQFSVEDAQRVWNAVGEWIVQYLCKHKAVMVPGLGTFTLSEWTLDTGLGKPLIFCRPTFFLSEHLAQSFSIRQRQVFVSNKVACHMIHYGGVAALSGMDKSMVKICVQEVTQALKRLLWEKKNVALDLGPVGRLQVRDKQVVMEFQRSLEAEVRALTERRRVTEQLVYPWSPKKILE